MLTVFIGGETIIIDIITDDHVAESAFVVAIFVKQDAVVFAAALLGSVGFGDDLAEYATDAGRTKFAGGSIEPAPVIISAISAIGGISVSFE